MWSTWNRWRHAGSCHTMSLARTSSRHSTHSMQLPRGCYSCAEVENPVPYLAVAPMQTSVVELRSRHPLGRTRTSAVPPAAPLELQAAAAPFPVAASHPTSPSRSTTAPVMAQALEIVTAAASTTKNSSERRRTPRCSSRRNSRRGSRSPPRLRCSVNMPVVSCFWNKS